MIGPSPPRGGPLRRLAVTEIDAPATPLSPRSRAATTHALKRDDNPHGSRIVEDVAERESGELDDRGHDDHEHHGLDLLTAARIAYAGFCVIAIWFVEAFFFSIGSLGENLHEFFQIFDPWPVLAFGDLIPQVIRDLIPQPILAWIDYYLAMPFSTYAYTCLLFSGWPILKAA